MQNMQVETISKLKRYRNDSRVLIDLIVTRNNDFNRNIFNSYKTYHCLSVNTTSLNVLKRLRYIYRIYTVKIYLYCSLRYGANWRSE